MFHQDDEGKPRRARVAPGRVGGGGRGANRDIGFLGAGGGGGGLPSPIFGGSFASRTQKRFLFSSPSFRNAPGSLRYPGGRIAPLMLFYIYIEKALIIFFEQIRPLVFSPRQVSLGPSKAAGKIW